MGDSRFLINGIGTEEGFLAEDVTSTHHIAHSLLILILDGHHKGAIQHEVYLVDVVPLREQCLPLVDLYHL